MMNWTEEDVKFICNNMINPAMEQMMKTIDMSYDSHSRTIDRVVDALGQVSYLQKREISFLRMLIIQYLHLDPKQVDELRDKYFERFDELNKEK